MTRYPVSKQGRKPFDLSLPPSVHTAIIEEFTNHLETSSATSLDRETRFKLDWQLKNMLSKLNAPGSTSSDARREAAIVKWLRAEDRNSQTNHRLVLAALSFDDEPDEKDHNDPIICGNHRASAVLRSARSIIKTLLGDTPPEDILLGGFSNGASTRVKRDVTAIAEKYVGEAHGTKEAISLFRERVLPYFPMWEQEFQSGRSSLIEFPGSVLFTVPKNSEIDRVACKEPEINMFMQKGVGDFIRSRLRRRGIDLNDQTSNQRLARDGSLERKLATLDLSSASDLISTQLINILLPLDWFVLLDNIRVKRTLIDDTWHELHMFSSMGNGFTFELESLVFYALSCAINLHLGIRGRVSVYGDDIITPTASAAAYPRIFSFLGFIINMKKSFWRGGFRESCGKHYYNGTDVTPFFVRKMIDDVPTLVLFLNNMRVWAVQYDLVEHEPFTSLYRLWVKFTAYVPRSIWGGREVGSDSSLISPHFPKKRLTASNRERVANQLGAYLQWLHSYGDRRETYAMRSEVSNPVKRDIYIAWADIISRRETMETSYGKTEFGIRFAQNRTLVRQLPTHLCWFAEL